ncbi:MAG: hypothetical protein LBQ88_00220 [Treponema sp.]|jgi:hypothetical protein|nr:hypothetical protein [Treponema sp.]
MDRSILLEIVRKYAFYKKDIAMNLKSIFRNSINFAAEHNSFCRLWEPVGLW